jgi:stearoyl-CoA desaturase (delta-9 desaturase)
VNILFLTLTPILGIPVLAWNTYRTGFELWMPALCLTMYAVVGLSICAGYHRYFAHKSYECSRSMQIFFAVFGAMAMQNSILRWSSGHRMHHAHVDSDWDPYNIRRGFWWAHILWIFHKDSGEDDLNNVEDLKGNAIVRWQHRWDKVLLFAGGFGIPLLVGFLFGNPIAGLLWGGFLRIVVVHHSTFFVNSIAHKFGSPTYDVTSSARDNWAVALLTMGEGYHSFHHRFPGDFRNGIRWFHWDPAKWFIQVLRLFGQASSLRSTVPPLIEKARMKVVLERLKGPMAGIVPPHGAEISAHIERARESFDAAIALWRKEAEIRLQGMADRWKEIRRAYRSRLKTARREWCEALRLMRIAGLNARAAITKGLPL